MFVCLQDLASELEKERTNRIIAQQTANQEKLQARASAAESASLRRQLNELAQQMEQEKKAATVKVSAQQGADSDSQHRDSTLELVSHSAQEPFFALCGNLCFRVLLTYTAVLRLEWQKVLQRVSC